MSGQPEPASEVTPTCPPPEPPYSVVLTMTTAVSQPGTWALATLITVPALADSRRRTLPPLQNVASKYVLTAVPEPVEPSPQVAGSSAPDWLEATSMR